MGCNEVKDNKNLPKILMVFEEGNDQQQAYCLKIKENFRYPKDVLYDIKSVINETFSIKLKIKNNIYDIQTSFNDSDIDMKNALQNMYDLLNKYENINPKFDDKEISLHLDKNEEEDILERERLREMKNEVLENQKRLRDNEDKKDDKEDIKNEEKQSNEINEEKKSNVENEEIRGNEDYVKNEEIKKEQETNNKINEVLEDMCKYGNIAKQEIIREKKKNPEKFIETKEALKLEDTDQGLFALGLLSTNLEDIGVETAIENNPDQDEGEEGLTSLQFITNGMISKKKYDLHFEFGEKRNDELLNNKEEYEKFKSNLKLKLSKDYNIPVDKIIVTFPQKGSFRVQVIFQSDEFNNLDINEFKKKFKNDPEFEELSNLKDIQTDTIVGGCKLSKALLDAKGNRNDGWAIGENRGGKPYDPPIGWNGIGLKVLDKYDNGDNSWIGMNNSPGEWCVAYHGVASGQRSDDVKKVTGLIVKDTFKAGRGQMHADCPDQYHPGKTVGVGVYCTPTIKTAGDQYAGISVINGVKYKTVLMVRVKPEAIRHCDQCSGSRAPYNYWVVNGTTDEIRPYRILYKKC